jgi:hypothetical protein
MAPSNQEMPSDMSLPTTDATAPHTGAARSVEEQGAGPAPLTEFRVKVTAFPSLVPRSPHWLKTGDAITENEIHAMGEIERQAGWIHLMNAVVLGRAYSARVRMKAPTDVFTKEACGYELRRIKEFRTVADALDGVLPLLGPDERPVEGEFLDLGNERTEAGVGLPPKCWIDEAWGIERAVRHVREQRQKPLKLAGDVEVILPSKVGATTSDDINPGESMGAPSFELDEVAAFWGLEPVGEESPKRTPRQVIAHHIHQAPARATAIVVEVATTLAEGLLALPPDAQVAALESALAALRDRLGELGKTVVL